MANNATTFSGYFQGLANPFVPAGTQYNGFTVIQANNPLGILASLESTQYPVVMIASRNDGVPVLYLAAFVPATLPGVAPPINKYAFYGDFSEAGNPPALTQVTPEFFHQTGDVTVLVAADIAAAWAAVPAGTNYLPVPGANANTKAIRTRCSTAVPHGMARAAIIAFSQGALTWNWAWANLATPLLQDPQLAADYAPFIDYLRVASTMRPAAPAAPAGAPDREPATGWDVTAAVTTPAVQDQAMSKAREFLSGLCQPIGVGAQLNLIAQQQATQNAALLAAQQQQDRPPTMARKAPTLLMHVR